MIGCGTVGGGVLELLDRRAADFESLLGRKLEVVRVAVRNPDRPRHHLYEFASPDIFVGDADSVASDPSLDVVVEVAGGVDSPRDWILQALRSGKDIVTANKATLAHHGEEIFGTAKECGKSVFYEASVAAAIPIIEMIQNGLVANRVTHLSAILNGTCNYILARMEFDDMGYEEALTLAQDKGFAEADPTLDVNGEDAAHKLTLLARILTRSGVPFGNVHTEGIENIAREDMNFAADLGYRIKLLGIAHSSETGAWDIRVHPTMIDRSSILAQVHNEYNACYVRADAAGPMLIYGNGAGSFPTASSVVSDIVRSAKGENGGSAANGSSVELTPIADVALRNYIRLTVKDTPGVLGRITSHFGMKGISISSIRQPDAKSGQPVPVVMVTHRAKDSVISDATDKLREVGLLLSPPTRIRIED